MSTQLSRTGTTSARRSGTRRTGARRRLGAGLVEIPAAPYRDPGTAMHARTRRSTRRGASAGAAESPSAAARDGAPGRTEGFCRKCGAPFSFAPKLARGRPGRRPVRGRRLPRPRRDGLDLPGAGPQRLRPLGRAQGPAQQRRRRRDGRGARRAALPRRGRAPEHRQDPQLRRARAARATSSWSTSAATSLKDILRARARRTAAHRRPAARRRRPSPTCSRSSRRSATCTTAGCCSATSSSTTSSRPQHSLKLIDLGGVYRIDDADEPDLRDGRLPGARDRPGRPDGRRPTCTRWGARSRCCASTSRATRGRSTSTPAGAGAVPLLQRFDSLYRFLAKATAPDRDDRFQSADEMADQLFGVLREVVARGGRARPWPRTARSSRATSRADPARADWRRLPVLRVATDDPAAGYLATLSATEPASSSTSSGRRPVQTVEVALRLARALIEAGEWRAAHDACDAIEAEDPWEWRAAWARGVACLAERRAGDAVQAFGAVYEAMPGELAPKLALGVAHELAGAPERRCGGTRPSRAPIRRTPPRRSGWPAAAWPLGDRAGALAAYDHVLPSSSSHEDAQIAKVDLLAGPRLKGAPDVGELRAAESTLESLTLDPERHARLAIKLLLAALAVVDQLGSWPGPESALLGVALTERDLRAGTRARISDARARHRGSRRAHPPRRPRQRCSTHDVDMSSELALRCSACDAPLLVGRQLLRGVRRGGGREGGRSRDGAPRRTRPGRRRRRQRAGTLAPAQRGCLPPRARRLERHLAVVCDGISTSASGDAAARAAATAAADVLGAALDSGGDLEAATAAAVAAAEEAVEQVPATGHAALALPSCTLVSAACRDGLVVVGWVGDSRAYWLGGGERGPAHGRRLVGGRAGRRRAAVAGGGVRRSPRPRHHALGRAPIRPPTPRT